MESASSIPPQIQTINYTHKIPKTFEQKLFRACLIGLVGSVALAILAAVVFIPPVGAAIGLTGVMVGVFVLVVSGIGVVAFGSTAAFTKLFFAEKAQEAARGPSFPTSAPPRSEPKNSPSVLTRTASPAATSPHPSAALPYVAPMRPSEPLTIFRASAPHPAAELLLTRPSITSVDERSYSTDRITVAAYNILFPQESAPRPPFTTNIGYTRGKNNFPQRFPVIERNITAASPDIACLAEVSVIANRRFAEGLCSQDGLYDLISVPHTPRTPHGTGILFKKHRFTVIGTPLLHTKSYAEKTRTDLLLDLKDNDTGIVRRFISTHAIDPRDFDGSMKAEQMRSVIEFARTTPNGPFPIPQIIILAGDLNQSQFGDRVKGSELEDRSKTYDQATSIRYLMDQGFRFDGHLEATEYDKPTANSHTSEIRPKDGRKIDWVWSNDPRHIPEHLDLPEFDVSGSDHKMVLSRV